MKKLIILGAGANVDFGFPTGIELSKSIYSLWSNPNEEYITFLLFALEKHGKRFNSYDDVRKDAATKIKRLSERFYYAAADSIDDFLSQPLENFEVSFGKLTILNLILEKEREALATNRANTLFKWEANWLRKLFGLEFRFETIDKLNEKLTQDPIKFITFNYDRSLEYFIYNAIKNYYGLKQEEVISIYKKIEFYHVYGKLAPLEWESKDPNDRLTFGDDFKDFPYGINDKLYRSTSNIKVINEDRGNFEAINKKCKDWIQGADKVYILGFGFLESNYKLLGIEECKESPQLSQLPVDKFFYTTYGLSENAKKVISRKFDIVVREGIRATAYDLQIFDYILHHY